MPSKYPVLTSIEVLKRLEQNGFHKGKRLSHTGVAFYIARFSRNDIVNYYNNERRKMFHPNMG